MAMSKVMSLSHKSRTKTMGNTFVHLITEESVGTGGLQDEGDLGIFNAEGIQDILYEMNYKIEFIPYRVRFPTVQGCNSYWCLLQHPHLTVVANKTGDKRQYLKFIEQEMEVEVLQYLTGIQLPANHTISGVQFWPMEGGTVISMPVAGGWLTLLKNHSEQL